MRKLMIAAALSGSVLLAGCSTIGLGRPDRDRLGSELVGRSAKVATAKGQNSTLNFQRRGRITATFGRNQSQGRWFVVRSPESKLCFVWGGREYTRECWPYTQPFRRGQMRTVRSDRGNVVKVTLL